MDQPDVEESLQCATNAVLGRVWRVEYYPTLRAFDAFFESHPREWVDRSSPAYIERRRRLLRIPPTGVGGSFKSSLHRTPSTASSNPTHGSGWIVQVQPTKGRIGFLCCSSPSSLRREVREITNSS